MKKTNDIVAREMVQVINSLEHKYNVDLRKYLTLEYLQTVKDGLLTAHNKSEYNLKMQMFESQLMHLIEEVTR